MTATAYLVEIFTPYAPTFQIRAFRSLESARAFTDAALAAAAALELVSDAARFESARREYESVFEFSPEDAAQLSIHALTLHP
jgi:hypothetical protein